MKDRSIAFIGISIFVAAAFIGGYTLGAVVASRASEQIAALQEPTGPSPDLASLEARAESALDEIKAVYDGVSVLASFYGEESGTITASGERYRPWGFTAADRTSPFGAIFLVENRDNGRQTVVRINDRGPSGKYPKRRIDVSHGAARELGMEKIGLAVLRLWYIGSVGRVTREMIQARASEGD